MHVLARFHERYRQLALRTSIFDRVLIGNSIIIIFGAAAGTIVTRQMTLLGNIRLILFFSFVGILITLLVNRAIIKTALYPLHELGDALERVDSGQINLPDSLKNYQDPDIHRLVTAIDSMLTRIANYTSQLQAISERTINAQEEERVRIARSLHDDTAQSISMLIIDLERLGKLIPDNAPNIICYVSDAQQVATELLENVRQIIWDLRPSILDDLGLLAAIRWYARTNLEKASVKLDFHASGEITRLPPHLETMLFRIAQEAISNILRHANASKVAIHLWKAEQQVWLEIKDDGHGFNIEQISVRALGQKQLGLLGIQERTSLVHGGVNIASSPESGTCLKVYIPLPLEDSVSVDPGSKLPEEMRQP